MERRWKLRVVAESREELYDLEADPGEARTLRPDAVPPEVLARLRAALSSARP